MSKPTIPPVSNEKWEIIIAKAQEVSIEAMGKWDDSDVDVVASFTLLIEQDKIESAYAMRIAYEAGRRSQNASSMKLETETFAPENSPIDKPKAKHIGLGMDKKDVRAAFNFEPHEFVGRLDRWCEVCGKPDRDSIHVHAKTEAGK